MVSTFSLSNPPFLIVFLVAHPGEIPHCPSDDKEDTAGGHEARQRQQLEVIQRRETGEASLSRHDLTRCFCIM